MEMMYTLVRRDELTYAIRAYSGLPAACLPPGSKAEPLEMLENVWHN